MLTPEQYITQNSEAISARVRAALDDAECGTLSEGSTIRERDAAICADISDADVNRMEAEMSAAHESFVVDRLKEKNAEAVPSRPEVDETPEA